jgi:hypothetical protein
VCCASEKAVPRKHFEGRGVSEEEMVSCSLLRCMTRRKVLGKSLSPRSRSHEPLRLRIRGTFFVGNKPGGARVLAPRQPALRCRVSSRNLKNTPEARHECTFVTQIVHKCVCARARLCDSPPAGAPNCSPGSDYWLFCTKR